MELTKQMAWQLALMLESGVPAQDAIVYFMPEADATLRAQVLNRWLRASVLREAIKELQGNRDWHLIPLAERLQRAIDKHYSELAYFLYTHNYSEVSGLEKTKSDTARATIESRLAELSGKHDPLMAFLQDVKAGKFAAPPTTH